MFYKKSCFEKFNNIYRKKYLLESLFNKAADLKASNFIKNGLQQVFSCEHFKIFEQNQKMAASDGTENLLESNKQSYDY